MGTRTIASTKALSGIGEISVLVQRIAGSDWLTISAFEQVLPSETMRIRVEGIGGFTASVEIRITNSVGDLVLAGNPFVGLIDSSKAHFFFAAPSEGGVYTVRVRSKSFTTTTKETKFTVSGSAPELTAPPDTGPGAFFERAGAGLSSGLTKAALPIVGVIAVAVGGLLILNSVVNKRQ